MKRSISYQAYYRDENGKWKSQACKLIKAMNGETAQESHTFQLSSETTPEGVKAISPQLAASLATAHGVTLRRSIDYTLLPDSLGYYRGTTDSIYQPNGHGCWQGYDGTYYEGYWKTGNVKDSDSALLPRSLYE